MKKRLLLTCFGMVGGVLFLELLLRLPWQTLWNPRLNADSSSVRVLALGESTTQGGFGPYESYPDTLERNLREHCPRAQVEVWNAGLAGARSEDVLRDLPRWINATRPHFAFVMMGINDLQGTGGPVNAIGRSSWRIVRFWNWIAAGVARRLEPKARVEDAGALVALDRWTYYRIVTQALRNQHKYRELEQVHREVLKKGASRPAALDLGSLLRESGRAQEALEWHQKARPGEGVDPWVEWEILLDLEALGKEMKPTEELLLKGAKDLPLPLVTSLVDFFVRRKTPERAALLLEKASERPLGQQILQWRRTKFLTGKARQEAANVAEAAQLAPYPESLKKNYQALVRELVENGVKVTALTYPRLPAAPLELVVPTSARVLSLEDSFNNAVKEKGYDAIFYDSFGGNFGHLSRQGNELLAEILEKELLKEEPFRNLCK